MFITLTNAVFTSSGRVKTNYTRVWISRAVYPFEIVTNISWITFQPEIELQAQSDGFRTLKPVFIGISRLEPVLLIIFGLDTFFNVISRLEAILNVIFALETVFYEIRGLQSSLNVFSMLEPVL